MAPNFKCGPEGRITDRFVLLLVLTFLVSAAALGAAPRRDPKIPSDVLFQDTSLKLRDLKISLTAETRAIEELGDLTLLPARFRIAIETGHLVTIDDPTASWQVKRGWGERQSFELSRSKEAIKAKEDLERVGYRAYEDPNIARTIFMLPNQFFESDLEKVYEDEVESVILEYHENWNTNEQEIASLVGETAQLESTVSDKEKSLAVVEATRKSLEAAIVVLEARSNQLGNLALVEGAAAKDLLSLFKAKITRFVYDPNKDYLRDTLKEEMSPIPSSIPDNGSVANRYLQRETIDALNRFYDSLSSDDLAALGIGSKDEVRLASAARTPLQQIEVQQQNPVAIGMFSTRHAFGVATDLQFSGLPFNIKSYNDAHASPSELEQLLDSGGTPISDAQKAKLAEYVADKQGYVAKYDATKAAWQHLVSKMKAAGFNTPPANDANHFNLTRFDTDSAYADGVRLRVLKSYNAKMIVERFRQISDISTLTNKNSVLRTTVGNLDASILAVTSQIEELQQKRAALEAEVIRKEREAERRRQQELERRREPREPRDPPERRERHDSGIDRSDTKPDNRTERVERTRTNVRPERSERSRDEGGGLRLDRLP